MTQPNPQMPQPLPENGVPPNPLEPTMVAAAPQPPPAAPPAIAAPVAASAAPAASPPAPVPPAPPAQPADTGGVDHVRNVLDVATSGAEADEVRQVARFAPREKLEEALAIVVPPTWRETLPAVFKGLDEAGLATVLAWLALCYRQGYEVGQADLTEALAQRGLQP